jgi:TrmH family RNA methyltransferase
MNKKPGNQYNNVISSRNNNLINYLVKLKDKNFRDSEKVFFFEGIKLYEEALKSGVVFDYIVTNENFSHHIENNISVTSGVYLKITEEKSPEGIFCAAKYIDFFHNNVKIYSNRKINGSQKQNKIILSAVRDPGNVGAVIRSAKAFATDEVIVSADCADIYNSKTLRASMGAVFDQKITRVSDIKQAVAALRDDGFTVLAAAAESGENIKDISFNNRDTAIVIGNEGSGLDSDIINECSGTVYIPMASGTESLNAAAAASIIMWEVYRQNDF